MDIMTAMGFSGKKAWTAVLWALLLMTAHGHMISQLKPENVTNMKGTIILCPVGEVEAKTLDFLRPCLEQSFGRKIAGHAALPMPKNAWNAARQQYPGASLLDQLTRLVPAGSPNRVLGVTDADLYAEGLTFVFGQAELGGQSAVISLARLRQSFYGLPDNLALFQERAKKEAVHELGHVFGLFHCSDPECVMHFSNSLMDTDQKGTAFCGRCQKLLSDLMK